MSIKGFTNINNDNLILYIDSYNKKSYVSGDTVTSDLVTNDFGKFDLSWTDPSTCFISDVYNDLLFLTDWNGERQSIYNLSTDTSYTFGSDVLGGGGAKFDTNEIVNGLPVLYGSGIDAQGSVTSPYFKKYEYQGNNTWSNTFTKSLTNRNYTNVSINTYNTTNGKSDIWLCSSNTFSSTQWLTLHQWNSSDYDEYNFTSGISSFLPYASKFACSATFVSSGRTFLSLVSFTSPATGVNKQAVIVEMLYTGSTYTDVNDWAFTKIAGGTSSNMFGDTDGLFGVNKLSFGLGTPSQVYRGDILNGEPRLFLANNWRTSWGNASDEAYIRELFWNGSAWEVTTNLTYTDRFSFAIQSPEQDKFYFQNNDASSIKYFDLTTGGTETIVPCFINQSIDQERVPKTIDLINGVGFDDKSWSFDRVNDYININPILPLIQNDTQGTIELWVKYSTAVDFMCAFSIGRTSGTNNTLGIVAFANGRFNAFYEINSVLQWQAVPPIPTTPHNNNWVHIVLTQDGILPKVYINGDVTLGSGIDTTKWLDDLVFDVANIGRSQNNGIGRYWGGDISNVKYYNRALSAEEVKQNYNGLKWRFNQ